MITEQNVQDHGANVTETATQSLGAIFHHARIALNLQQKDVASQLKMNVAIVQAIEANEWQKLGAPVFVRMYLQRYAQLLNLPENDILARYKALGIDTPPPLKMAHSVQPQHNGSMMRWVAYPLVLVLLVWLGWFGVERLSAHFEIPGVDSLVQNQEKALDTAGTVIPDSVADASVSPPVESVAEDALANVNDSESITTPIETPLLSDSGEAHADEIIANVTVASDATIAEQQEQGEIIETATSVTPEGSAEMLPKAPISAAPEDSALAIDPNATDNTVVAIVDTSQTQEHQLFMRFEKDCWVEVKDADGERLAYGIFKADATGNWSGKAPFSITLGNAQGTEIRLDGETIDRSVYAPKRGTVSRFILNPAQRS